MANYLYITLPGTAVNPPDSLNPNPLPPYAPWYADGYHSDTAMTVYLRRSLTDPIDITKKIYYKIFYRSIGGYYDVAKQTPNDNVYGRCGYTFTTNGSFAGADTSGGVQTDKSDARLYFDDAAVKTGAYKIAHSVDEGSARIISGSISAVETANEVGGSGDRSFSIAARGEGVEIAAAAYSRTKALTYSFLASGLPPNPGEVAIDPVNGTIIFYRESMWDDSATADTCWDDADAYWDNGGRPGYHGVPRNELKDVLITDGEQIDTYAHIENTDDPSTTDTLYTQSALITSDLTVAPDLIAWCKVSFFTDDNSFTYNFNTVLDQYYEIGTAIYIALRKGLNLISIPRQNLVGGTDTGFDIASVLQDQNDVGSVLTYVDGEWKVFVPGGGTTNTLSRFYCDKGYIVDMSDIGEINVTGNIPSGAITINVKDGLNIIGAPISDVTGRDIDDTYKLGDGTVVDYVVIYRIDGGLWQTYFSGSDKPASLQWDGNTKVEREKGYIIMINGDQTVQVTY